MRQPSRERLLISSREARLSAIGLSRALHELFAAHESHVVPPDPRDPLRQHTLLLNMPWAGAVEVGRSNVEPVADFQVRIIHQPVI